MPLDNYVCQNILLPSFPSEQCAEGVEVVFQYETEALSVERIGNKESVVCLVINPHGNVSVRQEKIS